MTTIAYNHKDKQVAVDSRCCRGDLIDSDNHNKTIINKRGLWVFCGATSDAEYLMSLNKREKVAVRPDCSAFLISKGSVYLVDTDRDGYCFFEKLDCNTTIGSGGAWALAAMDFGKTAKEVVNYAKTRDTKTGGKVRVFNV